MMALNGEWYLTPIELEDADRAIIKRVFASPDDVRGRGIDLRITHEGEPVDMTGQDVYLTWRHKSLEGVTGTKPFDAVEASQGRFRIEYSEAMEHPGEVFARIMIWVSEGVITTSRTFIIDVEENVVRDEWALRDTDFSMFVQAIEKLHGYEQDALDQLQHIGEVQERAEEMLGEAKRTEDEWRRFSSEAQADWGSFSADAEQAEAARKDAEQWREAAEMRRENESARAVEEADTAAGKAWAAAAYASAQGDAAKAVEEQLRAAYEAGDLNGATFTPVWDGTALGFENDKGLPNPAPVDLKGEKGDKGDQGDPGLSPEPLGGYPTEKALKEAHPIGNVGDAYLVMNDFYIWDGEQWLNCGPFQGPAGNGVEGITAYYAVTDGSEPAPDEFSEEIPVGKAGQYLWTRTEFVTTDGECYSFVVPIVIPGGTAAIPNDDIDEMFRG